MDDPAVPVRAVRSTLRRKCPMELVFYIMGLADYHPVVRAERKDLVNIEAGWGLPEPWPSAAQLYLVTPPIPCGLPDESWKVRRVAWYIEGHDQGWGGEAPGQYTPAYSWYEACILRPDPSGPEVDDPSQIESLDEVFGAANSQQRLKDAGWALVPNGDAVVWRVQSNRIAKRDYEQHEIVWTADPTAEEVAAAKEHGASDGRGFVKELRPGDRIGLWMRAMQRGWENYLQEARIEVVYTV